MVIYMVMDSIVSISTFLFFFFNLFQFKKEKSLLSGSSELKRVLDGRVFLKFITSWNACYSRLF